MVGASLEVRDGVPAAAGAASAIDAGGAASSGTGEPGRVLLCRNGFWGDDTSLVTLLVGDGRGEGAKPVGTSASVA